MSAPLRRAAIVVVALAIVAGLMIAFAPPDSRASITRLAVLVVGIAMAAWLLWRSAAVTRSTPERFEAELRQPVVSPSEIPSLRAIHNTLALATASAFGTERRLKPLLRELAAWRLLSRRGIDMIATPEKARNTIGEALWHSIQAADDPIEYGAPGITLAAVQASLDQLERI